ncbi:MAG: hypothetical protein ACFFC7_28135 [Candidatus Hermodarchaeota archaeon]
MEKSPLSNWKAILKQFLQIVYTPLKEKGYKWAVIGSMASVLQGVPVIPKDLDIIVVNPKIVYFIAELLVDFTPEKKTGNSFEDEVCFSSKEQPVYEGRDDYDYFWVFGRWKLGDADLEIAHITAPEGFLESEDHDWIWEAGPEIWPFIRSESFEGYEIPVVPLEIQLETNSSRGMEERADQIVKILLTKGYDKMLLQKALCKNCTKKYQDMIA